MVRIWKACDMSVLDDHVALMIMWHVLIATILFIKMNDPADDHLHVSPNLKVRNPQNKTQQRGSICMGHDVCANSRTVDWIPLPYK
ncbi:hypothetical protein ACFX2C_039361 [Malus domestica]